MNRRYRGRVELAVAYACFADFSGLPLDVHVCTEVGGFAGSVAHVGTSTLSQARVATVGASPTAVGPGICNPALERR